MRSRTNMAVELSDIIWSITTIDKIEEMGGLKMAMVDCYDAQRDREEAEAKDCPTCGSLMFPVYENYGADRDGRRGMEMVIYVCQDCGEEG